jgi:hypothetical protein
MSGRPSGVKSISIIISIRAFKTHFDNSTAKQCGNDGCFQLQEASASEMPSIAADALTVRRSILRVLQVVDRFEGNLHVGFTLTNSGRAS